MLDSDRETMMGSITPRKRACLSALPCGTAPTGTQVERLASVARTAAGDRFSSVEVVRTADPETAEPMWVAVVWLLSEAKEGDDVRRRKLLRTVHETLPGEWFGRLVAQVRSEPTVPGSPPPASMSDRGRGKGVI